MKGHIREEEIALLAGGDLDNEEAAVLTAHLAACPDCSARLATYQAGCQSMSALGDTGIEAGDCDSVRRSVLQRIGREHGQGHRFGRLQWGALAAAFLVAVGAIAWWRISTPPPQHSAMHVPAGPVQVTSAPVQVGSGTGPVLPSKAVHAGVAAPANRPPMAPHKPTANTTFPPIRVAEQSSSPAHLPAALDDVIMKLETSDPNVIIIWLASPKGVER